MKRLREFIMNGSKEIALAGFRFPMTVMSLVAAALIIFRLIAMDETLPLLHQKLMFTLVVGAVLGMAVQFLVERFNYLTEKRIIVYAVGLLLLIGYFLILLSAPGISAEITVRSLVAVFALVCIAIWIPYYKSEVNFNLVALVHFKTFFTSLLYSGVLMAGTSAIIAAVDNLLISVHSDTYLYNMTVIWVLFAPVYYLSQLPKFNSELDEDQSKTEHASNYPKFLEILVAYIAIPLISAYTVVLIAYFLKIIFTLTWPSGQVGPMVLIYSIAGLLVYILSSVLENRFALFYRKIFPKILIIVVIMQLISVGIRLNNYGVTEARYYVGIFGIFSIIVAVLLSFSPVAKNGRIALLAAAFAVFSIIPPLDAFTVSRHSQIDRIESILENEGMLVNGEIVKKENASEFTRLETTNILNYLERSSSLEYIDWLPEEFEIYSDMKATFGFEPTYPGYTDGDQKHFYVSLDAQIPLPVSGYDVMLSAYVGSYMNNNEMTDKEFEINGISYRIKIEKTNNDEVRVAILDSSERELVGTDLNDFAKELAEGKGLVEGRPVSREALHPDEMSLDVMNNEYALKIVFQNISYTSRSDTETDFNYALYILFATPDSQ